MFLPSSLCCLFHQSLPSSLSICPILFTSLHKCFDISHTGYTDLPRVHLCRKALQQANELSLFDYGLIHSRTLRKIQSLKSVFLTFHDSLKTKGCLCRHGLDIDPSACHLGSYTLSRATIKYTPSPLWNYPQAICFHTWESQIYSRLVCLAVQ